MLSELKRRAFIGELMIEHGDYAVERFDDTVLCVAKGPFNKEAFNGYVSAYREASSSLNDSNWASLTILIGESLLTEENKKLYSNFVSWRVGNGLSKAIVVYLDCSCPLLTEQQISGILNVYTQLEYVSTASLEEAINILIDDGYLVNESNLLKRLKSIEWHSIENHCTKCEDLSHYNTHVNKQGE